MTRGIQVEWRGEEWRKADVSTSAETLLGNWNLKPSIRRKYEELGEWL
jgi:hypothetical protein